MGAGLNPGLRKGRCCAMNVLVSVFLLLAGMVGMAGAEPVRDVVKLTNGFRAQNGLRPLAVSPDLETVAEAHGRDLVKRGFFPTKARTGRARANAPSGRAIGFA